ncbi:MAG TPA: restriction endonuclease subunit S, partial [Desulfosporosinus sp.]|nr:restriction endonuclease subunit S [Desulfosporosinus sp.]
STGVPSLSKTAINAIEVRTSNYREQKIIGNFFANLDHLITLHQRKLKHLQEQKKALLQQMFV